MRGKLNQVSVVSNPFLKREVKLMKVAKGQENVFETRPWIRSSAKLLFQSDLN